MKKRSISKIAALFFSFIFLCSSLCCFPTSGLDRRLIDDSDVFADLEEMGLDVTRYQKNISATHCEMLDFLEWGHDYYGSTGDYGLYVYLYNPSGKEISRYGNNYIQMQTVTSSGVESGFVKYRLTTLSYSTVEGYEKVFYKFRVENVKDLATKVEKGLRQYDISGVEIQFAGDSHSTDFKVGGIYSFNGFIGYHDAGRVETSSLRQFVRDRVTVDLELHPCTWKTKTSDKGAGYQYEVFSVYFAVPNEIIRDYGDKENITKGLKKIDGSFEEYKLNGVATNVSSRYSTLTKYVGVKDTSSDDIPFVFTVEKDILNCFNSNGVLNFLSLGENQKIHRYGLAFRYSGNKLNIDSETISAKIEEMESLRGGFYTIPVDEGRVAGKQLYSVSSDDEDLAYSICTYASTHKKFLSWLSGKGELYDEDESYSGISPIRVVSSSDVSGVYSASYIAEQLFISESDVPGLKEFVKSSGLKGKTVYLMRFAVRDYFCNTAKFYDRSAILTEGTFSNQWDGGFCYFEKTAFLNFDIISLTYENQYAVSTVLPVVSSPIDVLGNITSTPSMESKNFVSKILDGTKNILSNIKDALEKWAVWVKILAVVLILGIVLFVLSRFGGAIGLLFRGIGSIVAAPFRLAGKGVKAARETGDRRREKQDRTRKQRYEDEDRKQASEDRTRKQTYEDEDRKQAAEDRIRRQSYEDSDREQASQDRSRRQRYEDEDRKTRAEDRKAEKERQKHQDEIKVREMHYNRHMRDAEFALKEAEDQRRQENHDYIKSKRGGK